MQDGGAMLRFRLRPRLQIFRVGSHFHGLSITWMIAGLIIAV